MYGPTTRACTSLKPLDWSCSSIRSSSWYHLPVLVRRLSTTELTPATPFAVCSGQCTILIVEDHAVKHNRVLRRRVSLGAVEPIVGAQGSVHPVHESGLAVARASDTAPTTIIIKTPIARIVLDSGVAIHSAVGFGPSSKLLARDQSFTTNGSKPSPVEGCGVGLRVGLGVAVGVGVGAGRPDEDESPHPPATMQTSIRTANNSRVM